jgi:hypothetical protein
VNQELLDDLTFARVLDAGARRDYGFCAGLLDGFDDLFAVVPLSAMTFCAGNPLNLPFSKASSLHPRIVVASSSALSPGA